MTTQEQEANQETKRERIELRLPASRKALIQHAADLEGRSVSDFVLSVAQRAAEETIRAHEVLTLTVEESQHFLEVMENPPEPSDYLRTAATRYLQTYQRPE